MRNKGISPLIATVLLLGFTVALAAIIMTWGKSFEESDCNKCVQMLDSYSSWSSDCDSHCKCVEYKYDIDKDNYTIKGLNEDQYNSFFLVMESFPTMNYTAYIKILKKCSMAERI